MNIKKSISILYLAVVATGVFASKITEEQQNNYCTAQTLHKTVFFPCLRKLEKSSKKLCYSWPAEPENKDIKSYLDSIKKCGFEINKKAKGIIFLATPNLNNTDCIYIGFVAQLLKSAKVGKNYLETAAVLLELRNEFDKQYQAKDTIYTKEDILKSIAMCDAWIFKGLIEHFLADWIACKSTYAYHFSEKLELYNNDKQRVKSFVKSSLSNCFVDENAMKVYLQEAVKALKNNPKYK